MTHDCEQKDLLLDLHGKVCGIETHLSDMNGSIKKTVDRLDEHVLDSDTYRHRITMVWTVLHTFKYLIMLVFGSGLILHIVKEYLK